MSEHPRPELVKGVVAAKPAARLQLCSIPANITRTVDVDAGDVRVGAHENIVGVVDCIRADDGHFALVLDYFEHDDFKDYLRRITIHQVCISSVSLVVGAAVSLTVVARACLALV